MDTQTQEALHKALKVLNCLNNDRAYETAWVKGAINACEEALAQPLTRDWKETIDERIAKDDMFKEALAQPAQEHKCSSHPDAPHGFCRDASHSAGRYVCECEGWEAEQPSNMVTVPADKLEKMQKELKRLRKKVQEVKDNETNRS